MQGRLVLGLVLSLFLSATALANSLPVKSFSRLPAFTKLELSPSGERLAFIQNLAEEGLSVLVASNLANSQSQYLLKSDNEKIKVNWFEWANEETLIVSVRYAGKRHGTDTLETRLLAIDVNKHDQQTRVLIKPRSGSFSRQHFSQFQDNVIDFLPDDPEHILVAVDLDRANLPSVYKLNIYSLSKTRIEKGKRKIRDWMTDQQHNLRVGFVHNYKNGERSALIRNLQTDEWQHYFEYDSFTEKPIYPVGFGLDPNILYFKQYQGDKLALYKLNLVTNQQELVFEDADFDVDGRLIYSNNSKEVIGITHLNSATGRIYWDQSRKKLQQALDKALPDTDNYLTEFSADENRYLLYSEGDSVPGRYFLGNRKEGALEFVFGAYPELDPSQLGQHERVTYQARDGVEISAYLSLPLAGSAPYPTIIHPHGGPGARDVDGFDYWTSFFTNRGYAVLRPNFRGSTGFGYEFSQSQMKRWGLEMQDDLQDGLNWLVEQDVADKDKVCIVGASYGGYAALMGVAKTPEAYKCAISVAGVSSLPSLVMDSRRYTNAKSVKNQIGDDFDDLEQRSPYYQAKRITAPVLLIHGEDDRVVDVKHSRMMADELQDEDKEVLYIELENGDHYLSIQRNRHAAFQAMDEFLHKYLN